MIYKKLIRPLLFRFDPEHIHEWVMNGISISAVQTLLKLICKQPNSIKKNLFGIEFPNPVGLAAGFDKDAAHIDGFAAMGFGFVEIGTVTPKAQSGNPQPRLFRLPEDKALINRMGFNNKGQENAVANIKKSHSGIIIGGNIGKNKLTPNKEAVNDYLQSFDALFDYVDYFVVNVSSPNTPGLRELQEKKPLTEILKRLQEHNQKKGHPKPVLLKIAPDLSDGQIDDIIVITEETETAGLVASNTTISRKGLKTKDYQLKKIGDGGLSGQPVFTRSNEIIRQIKKRSSIPVIGAGGIMSAQNALEKIKAGADLIQIYTGLIYEGPFLIKRINSYLAKMEINK